MFSNVDSDALEARFGQTEIQGVAARDAEADPAEVIQESIDDAVAEAAAFLSVRYTISEALAAPQNVAAMICDIARFRLYDEAPPDVVKEAYERARTDLKAIAAGTLNVFDPDASVMALWNAADTLGGAIAAGGGGTVAYRENRGSTETPARVFTRDTLAGY